ncbi:DEKNAAC102780 [Brettanomyces naardenensis]|uniref:DEKNAAC102780 n=1 Tax=Brettanomyces naardenensis TaxID=13370 RepID=A0A448YL92_BRENA|nr:DEKNAAC102780 [Brettanomyces naardenensis]
MNSDRLLYRTPIVETESGLPVYVFDTTFIPSRVMSNTCTEQEIRQFTDGVWKKLPSSEQYCLVFFTTAFSKLDFSSTEKLKLPLNFVRFFQLIPVDKRDLLVKLYIVHGNWLITSFIELFKTIWNFGRQIVRCENLTRLAEYMDITAIPISLTTYMVDRTVYNNRTVMLDKRLPAVYGTPLTIDNHIALTQLSRIYNNLLAYLKTPRLNLQLTQDEWQMVLRINYLDEDTKLTVSILSGCIKRNQAVYLSDFSFLEHYIILMKFVYKLSESSDPLIPLEAVLANNSVDYDNADELNTLFNDILIYQHSKKVKGTSTNGQYDNSYIIIKIFKFFHALLEKLNDEVEVFEDYAEDSEKVRRRQILRLILAFTKVLYDDNPDIDDPEEVGFDNLFKLVYAVMRHYNKLRVFGTDSGLDEFNNYLTEADFGAFEGFKSKVLLALRKRDEDERIEQRKEVKEEPKKMPALVRKPPPSSPSSSSIPVQDMRSVLKPRNTIDNEDKGTVTAPRKWKNELVKPSDQLTSRLIKYTEKDLIVQREHTRSNSTDLNNSLRNKVIKGRKVSELAKMYEEKFFAD